MERVESALSTAGCYQRSGNWTCPAHEDREPSLHLTANGQGVGVKCHAGCDTRDIVDAMGLRMEDLFEEPMKEVARYAYRSNGQVFEKIRLAAPGRKSFRWEPSTNGHAMPLYRIDEALALPDPVFVIESEKDVNLLLNMGAAATCMPGGAGSWRDEYTEALRGRDVIIVADRDEPGVKHALKLHALLGGKVVQSRTPGEHDDVGDHLAAGFGLDQLVPLHTGSEITKRYTKLDLHAAFREEPEDIQWLKEDFLESGTLSCLFSKPGVGKSLISLEIAIEVVRTGGTVMYMDDENRAADIVDRLRSFGCTPGELAERLCIYSFQNLPPLDTEAGGEHLAALAEENKPDLVILDTVSRMIKGGENDADTFIQLYRCSLTRLKKRGITILRLDHTGKDSARGQRGSSAKESDADCLWYLSRDGDSMFTLENQKSRAGHIPFGTIINLKRLYEPLRHVWDVHIDMPVSRFEGIMRQMDILGVPTSCGRPAVRKIFKDNGVVGIRNDQLSAAIIERRNRQRRLSHVHGDSLGQEDSYCPF
jgi:hypothetical protein